MIGFTFRNIHSSAYNLFVKSDNRTISPSLRKNEFVIPGRDGTLDYGLNTYDKRYITITLNLVKNSLQELRLQTRSVAQWLSKEGMLIFDDEPDKLYQAKIYTEIDIEQIVTRGITTIIFECQPFAESLEYKQVNVPEITTRPYSIIVDVIGTSETCPIMTIKNTGITTISSITITRKAEI